MQYLFQGFQVLFFVSLNLKEIFPKKLSYKKINFISSVTLYKCWAFEKNI